MGDASYTMEGPVYSTVVATPWQRIKLDVKSDQPRYTRPRNTKSPIPDGLIEDNQLAQRLQPNGGAGTALAYGTY
ncbi:unnamed protein product, partial [Iphiclides podalirius]